MTKESLDALGLKAKPNIKAEWTVPQRLIQKRLLVFPEPFDNDLQGKDCNYSDCHFMWLVKWAGLSYNNATWELENSSFLKTPKAMTPKNNYEARHLKPLSPNEIEGRKLGSPELQELPLGRSNQQSNTKLRYVKILRECLYRGQNAVVFYDKERIVKVVLFILSVLNETRQPFLIITPSNVISLWETEFNNWASSYTNIDCCVQWNKWCAEQHQAFGVLQRRWFVDVPDSFIILAVLKIMYLIR